jgi:para-nitrobenzyl esterase
MNIPLNTIVQTRAGKIRGSHENGLYVFKGVPYAAPPTGDLRWLPPQPHTGWNGVRPAQDFGAIAPQNESKMAFIREFETVEPQNEDCLYLNIWTPEIDDNRRPVMVWIHGGAFCMGSGTQLTFRRGILASRGDIVLVTLNYRLGLLGFLRLNEITSGKIPSTGNEGLLDQMAALEWVRDNISLFGGHPQNVTVFGESAGAMSIGCLMAMPGARGLFQKAILESAVGSMANPLPVATKASEQFLAIAGLEPGNSAAVRALSVDRILSIQREMSLRTPGGMAPVIPVADGLILPEMPLASIKAGTAAGIPVLIGTNLDEEKLFAAMNPQPARVDEKTLVKRVQRFVSPEYATALIDAYRQARARRGEPAAPADIWTAIQTDIMFRLGALKLTDAQCQHNQAAYNYLFTWKSPALGGIMGACHALEVGFVFGNYEDNFCGAGPEADRLSFQMQEAWTTFARTGDPSCSSLGNWPQYCYSRKTMILGKDSHVEMDPYKEERQIWEKTGS